MDGVMDPWIMHELACDVNGVNFDSYWIDGFNDNVNMVTDFN